MRIKMMVLCEDVADDVECVAEGKYERKKLSRGKYVSFLWTVQFDREMPDLKS